MILHMMERERHGVQVPLTSPDRYAAATPSVHDIPSLFFHISGRKTPTPKSDLLYSLRFTKVNLVFSGTRYPFRYFRSSSTYIRPTLLRIMFFFTIYPISMVPAVLSSVSKGTAT